MTSLLISILFGLSMSMMDSPVVTSPSAAASVSTTVTTPPQPTGEVSSDPTRAYAPELSADSLDSMIGRMIMIGFRGTRLGESDHILRDLKQVGVGGVILFDRDVPTGSPRRNIVGPDSLTRLIRELREQGRDGLLIAVDQEGGRVARLKPDRGFDRGLSAAAMARLTPDSSRAVARMQARQLHKLGFNVNFAPVVDVNVNPANPIIGRLDRSYSSDPEVVARMGEIVIESLREQGVIGVLKHFPGHGSSETDSHLGFVDITRTWSERELIPYRRMIEDGKVDAIMTAHVYNARLDSELPATLSKAVVTGILREQLGFDGVVFSDDMQMAAIRDHHPLEESAVQAVLAGVDILVFGNNAGIYEADIAPRAHAILKKAVEQGRLPVERIVEANRRIEAMVGSLARGW